MRTIGLGGKNAVFDAYIPYSCVSGSAVIDGEVRYRDVCGSGDATIRFSYNFVGAPTLEMSEFLEKYSEFVVGASVHMSIPSGGRTLEWVSTGTLLSIQAMGYG
jgi:hypothetical protein